MRFSHICVVKPKKCRFASSYGGGEWCAKLLDCLDCGEKFRAYVICSIPKGRGSCQYFEPERWYHFLERFMHLFEAGRDYLEYEFTGKEVPTP